MNIAQAQWSTIKQLDGQILAAVEKNNWDEVSTLAAEREQTIKHYINNANETQETELHQKILLLLDFNKTIVNAIRKEQDILKKRSLLLKKRHHANSVYKNISIAQS